MNRNQPDSDDDPCGCHAKWSIFASESTHSRGFTRLGLEKYPPPKSVLFFFLVPHHQPIQLSDSKFPAVVGNHRQDGKLKGLSTGCERSKERHHPQNVSISSSMAEMPACVDFCSWYTRVTASCFGRRTSKSEAQIADSGIYE